MTYLVVGSGPAGVSAALGLLSRGMQVTLIDAGLKLETSREQDISRMSSQVPDQWSEQDVRKMKTGMRPDTKGIPLKLVYGSDFPYRSVDSYFNLTRNQVGGFFSFAMGGLSNVWGAAMLPYLQEDIADWPMDCSSLTAHYRAVHSLFSLRESKDGLETLFPIYSDRSTALKLNRQGQWLVDKFNSNAKQLSDDGFYLGSARTAFNRELATGSAASDCVYCGLCMYGCPYRLIYSTSSSIEILKRYKNFTYLPSRLVTQVRESAEGAKIRAKNLETGTFEEYRANRLLLACGALSTTALLLDALNAYDHPVELLDTQIFLLPALLKKRIQGASSDPHHALAQLFLEIRNPQVSARTVHLQIYAFNSVYQDLFRSKLGPLYPLARRALNLFLERFIVVQGFLHSDHSSRMKLTLRRSSNEPGELSVERGSLVQESVITKVLNLLQEHRSNLGFRGITPLLNVAEPGRSFHYGGSFPMKTNPGPFQSDTLGRPHGLSRIHAVDATIFTSIPSTTITYTVMANAHRIGSEVDA